MDPNGGQLPILPYFLAGGIEVPPPDPVPGPMVVTMATAIAASPADAHPSAAENPSPSLFDLQAMICQRCSRRNHWGVDLHPCYWCGETLCSACCTETGLPMKSGEAEPHFCLRCGRKRTPCLYRGAKRFCVMCGKPNPAMLPCPEPPPGTVAPEGLQRMKCSYLYTLLPDICLIRILEFIGTLQGVMAASFVSHRMHALSSDNRVWWSLSKTRWPGICEHLLSDPYRMWLVYYRSRHDHYRKSQRHPTPIEDSDGVRCPLSFNDADGVTAQGRVFDTKLCSGCSELLIKCRSSDQVTLLAGHGVIRPAACTKGSVTTMSVPFAVHACGGRGAVPEALSALDWGFSAWYFGAIARGTAEKAMTGATIGTFLVRESLMRPAEYVVSVVVSDGDVEHIRIVKDHYGYQLGIAGRFASVPELVRYYTIHSLEEEFPEVRTVLVAPPAHQDVAALLRLRSSYSQGSNDAFSSIRLEEIVRQTESRHKAYLKATRVRRETLLGLCHAALRYLELRMSGNGDEQLPEGITNQLIRAGIATSEAELTTLFSSENFDVYSYVETVLRDAPLQASVNPTRAARLGQPADDHADRAGVGPAAGPSASSAGRRSSSSPPPSPIRRRSSSRRHSSTLFWRSSSSSTAAGAALGADDLDGDGGAPGSAT